MDHNLQPDQLLQRLAQTSKCFELAEVRIFKGYRKRKDGAIREVTIEVRDGGPGATIRYHIVATDEDGRQASGNGDNRLDVAVATVHWFDLDG